MTADHSDKPAFAATEAVRAEIVLDAEGSPHLYYRIPKVWANVGGSTTRRLKAAISGASLSSGIAGIAPYQYQPWVNSEFVRR
jgi:hypothetical protein